MAYTPDFEIAHIGVNCADAAQAERCAEQFAVLFQLAVNPAKESADARFTGTQIEWMKAPGRGEHGHIALATGESLPVPEDCGACRWYALCRGGCRRDRDYFENGIGRNYYCAAYRAFFEYAYPRLVQLYRFMTMPGRI